MKASKLKIVDMSPSADPLLMPRLNVASLAVLLGAITHELRTPLAALRAFAQLIEMNPECTPTLKGYVREIIASCTDLERRTNPLGSMVQSPRMAESDAIDLNGIVQETLTALGSELAPKGLRIEPQLAEALPLIRGNALQVRAIIHSLLRRSLAGRVVLSTTDSADGMVKLIYECDGAKASALATGHLAVDEITIEADFEWLIVRSIMRSQRGSITSAPAPDNRHRWELSFPKVPEKSPQP